MIKLLVSFGGFEDPFLSITNLKNKFSNMHYFIRRLNIVAKKKSLNIIV